MTLHAGNLCTPSKNRMFQPQCGGDPRFAWARTRATGIIALIVLRF